MRGRPGALVISLDFELHWGVRHSRAAHGPYRAALLGAREAVPRILSLFEEHGVAATWATVGLLFARTRAEAAALAPTVRARYADPVFDPWGETVGEGEDDDPLHYAPSLVARILRTPRQEVGTHTFSHFFCLERGAGEAAFRADLDAAVRAARGMGVRLRSIVFPRNQVNPAYLPALAGAGITCYRGTQRGWMYSATAREDAPRRAARLVDAYLPLAGRHTVPWARLRPGEAGVADVPASFFLRPVSRRLSALEPLRLKRLAAALRHAARAGEVVHVWWHPHNFGARTDENMRFLAALLAVYDECREREGMLSLGMAEAAALAREAA
jgi:peptidoglycan/xylan/chitin deacetylase (PgdA/CDA1 family)